MSLLGPSFWAVSRYFEGPPGRSRKAGVMGSNPIVGLQSSHVRSRRSTLSALPEVSPTGEHVARTAITDAPREPQR